MSCRIRQSISWFLLLGLCVLLIIVGVEQIATPSAMAVIAHQEEGPEQTLIQSRNTLTDLTGATWQAIAFKRIRPDGASVNLRLVGFPDGVTMEHPHPLAITTSMGKTFTAKDVSSQINTDTSVTPNVGQYDLQQVLPQLSEEMPVRLELPTTSGVLVTLDISPAILQEWQTVASQN